MKFQLTTPIRKVCGTLLGAAILVLFFQNCGKAGFDSNLDEGLAQSSTDPDLSEQFGKSDALKVAEAPFAFDAIADQITYNSCSGSGLTQAAGFYTFKIGAYEASNGMKLRTEFLDYLKENFKPIGNALELSDMQIKNFLAASPENKKAQLQFAIRSRGNPQQIRSPNTTLNDGTDYTNLMDSLTDDRFMDPLVKNRPSGVQYFPFGIDSTQRSFEAQITFNATENLAQNLRTDFASYAQLALTYTANDVGDAYVARFPQNATVATKVYGRAYNLSFSSSEQAPYTRFADYVDLQRTDTCTAAQVTAGTCVPKRTVTKCANGNCALVSNNPNNILAGISEIDMMTKSGTGGTWTCDPSRRYVIMKPSDSSLCPKESFAPLGNNMAGTAWGPSMTALEYQRELMIVRRSLPASHWDVNIRLRCAIPKGNLGCYPNNEQLNGVAVGIQYDQTMECFQGAESQTFLNGVPATKRCAHYVSICTRN